MTITHVLANGKKKTDIKGHVVKNKKTYEIISQINRRLQNENNKIQK